MQPRFDRSGLFPVSIDRLPAVVREPHGVAVIRLRGPLVRQEPVRAFLAVVEDLLGRGARKFAIDLREVPFVDSYGLGGFTAVFKSVRTAGGEVRFYAASDRIVQVMNRTHLDRVLRMFEDEGTALEGF